MDLQSLKDEKLANDTILRACRRQPVDHVPVWLMRQAGRYLPEFRKLREQHDFFTMCRTPELSAETTLQPLERFAIDAVIFFSDILVIPQALGFEVKMEPSLGPVLPNPLRDPATLEERVLSVPLSTVVERLKYVYDGLLETRRRLHGRVPLIGFVGAPWTLMCYIVDGSGSEKSQKGKFAEAISWLYAHPQASHQLLGKIADAVAEHLIQQANHGCHLVQLFDSWAGHMTPALYKEFGTPYLKRVAEKFKAACPDVPLICFPKGAFFAIAEIAKLGLFDVISLDSTMDPAWGREQVDGKVALQGNFDPLAMHSGPEVIKAHIKTMLNGFSGGKGAGLTGYIANLGHGCLPSYDPENVKVFVDTVHDYSKELLAQK